MASPPKISRALVTASPDTMAVAITIRFAQPGDELAWRGLWQEYLRFSRVVLPPSVTDATWRRIIAPDGLMKALLATDVSGGVRAFAIYVRHPYSFGEGFACCVDDMFVRSDARGLGIGRGLLTHLITLADEQGWSRVYWVASETNIAARQMFDRHFCHADGLVRYSLSRNGVHLEADGQKKSAG